MARNTTLASHRTCSVDRALWRAAAQSWHALGLTALVLICIAPALVVGVLLIVEAALSGSRTQSAHRHGLEPAPAGWCANAPHLKSFRPHDHGLNLRSA